MSDVAQADIAQPEIAPVEEARRIKTLDVLRVTRIGSDIESVVLSRAVRWHIENRILAYANKTVIFD